MINQLLVRLGSSSPLRIAALAGGCVALCCIAGCGNSTVTVNVRFTAGSPQGNGVLAAGYAYISSGSSQTGAAGHIYQYAIAGDGSLSPLAVPSAPTGVNPRAIIADPTGHFLYTANSGDNTIAQFAIGSAGALTPLAPAVISLSGVSPGAANYSLSIDPAGPHLYVVVSGSSGSQPPAVIGQFSIGLDGTLIPLAPAFVSLPSSASGRLAIDPTGAYAYLAGNVGNPGAAASAGEVFEFKIASDGTLSRLGAGSVSAAAYVGGIAVAPSGRGAYVLSDCTDTNCDGSIAPYAITGAGELSQAGAATLTGTHVSPVDLVIDGSGSTAYLIASFNGVDTDFGTLYQYSISSTGALSQMPASFPLTGGATAERQYGPDLYVLSGSAGVDARVVPSVAIYTIGSNGELTPMSSTPIAASFPTDMVLVAAH